MRKTAALLVSAVLGVLLCGCASARVPVILFYHNTRPMNAFTELTRLEVGREIGVDMQLIRGGDNWKEQLSLLMADDDEAVDIVALMDVGTFRNYAAAGAFYDLTDLLADYPNIIEYLSGVDGYSAEDMLSWTTVNGRIFGLPSITVVRSYYTESIRSDWLERLGLSVPQTLEDWRNVMRAFTYNDPDGNGLDDTYGFSGSRQYNSLTPFFGAFGARPDQCYFLDDDGRVVTNVISEAYRSALRYLRDIYAEGLIDPEMLIANDYQINRKWVDGRFGIWNSWWSGAGNAVVRYHYTDQNPVDSIQILNPPIGPDGLSGVIAQEPCENFFAVSARSDKVDAALRLIDYACTTEGQRTLMWGVEGQFWTQDADGNIDWYTGINGTDKYGNSIGDMQAYRFFYNIPIENSVWHLSDTMANRLYQQSSESYMQVPVYTDLFFGLSSEAYVTRNDDLASFVEESGIRFIMGIADLEEDWNAYVKDYLARGGEAVRTSLLQAYNRRNGTALTFAEAAQ